MDDFPKRQLLINYLLDNCTPEQQAEVEYWLDKEPGNVALLQRVALEMNEEKRSLSGSEKEEIKQEVMAAVGESQTVTSPSVKRGTGTVKASRFASYGRWIKAAAVILVIVVSGALSLYYKDLSTSMAETEVEWQQQSLSRGQTATLRFGEGTVVNLNAASTLRYPDKFSLDKREVYLEGEAFFSVSPDSARPFIVHTNNTTTHVLGTAFNVRAYDGEGNVHVAVAEGKVRVSYNGKKEKMAPNSKSQVLLTKNQWMNYRSSNHLIVRGEGGVSDLIAWKDKKLVFNDESLEEIAKRLERWYNIDITLADSSLSDLRMSASFEKETVTEVLTVIALSMNIHYTKEEGKVIFRK